MHDFPKGTYDFHLHSAPDVVRRKLDDLELGQRLVAAGMKGCVLKFHHGETATRAALLKQRFPGLNIAGGVVLNHAAGGLNPRAVEVCAGLGGRIVWFPTMDSRTYQAFHQAKHPDLDLNTMIPILMEDGELNPAVEPVLRAAARHGMIVATGHISSEEGMALVRRGAALGCKMLLTHAALPSNRYSQAQLTEAVALGATVEFCFFTPYYNRTPIEEIAADIRHIGCENVILGTDFGQPDSPYPDEGIAMFAAALRKLGFRDEELLQMLSENQEKLMGWN